VNRLLLASNSTNPDGAYLAHLAEDLRGILPATEPIAFVPYALADLDAYADRAETTFRELGLDLRSIHRADDPADAVARSAGVFVGGGNTFRLLDRVIGTGVDGAIRELVAEGAPYVGTSAGSNLACPSIMTTNDMPIVRPSTFDALGLVSFQINPHYVDRDPDVAHGGETRRQRIAEFHEEWPTPVVGLREGSWLAVAGSEVELRGPANALLFRPGSEPRHLEPGRITID